MLVRLEFEPILDANSRPVKQRSPYRYFTNELCMSPSKSCDYCNCGFGNTAAFVVTCRLYVQHVWELIQKDGFFDISADVDRFQITFTCRSCFELFRNDQVREKALQLYEDVYVLDCQPDESQYFIRIKPSGTKNARK